MRLPVTGGAGFTGSVVAELALAAGRDVVVLDDLLFTHGPFDAVLHLAAEAAREHVEVVNG